MKGVFGLFCIMLVFTCNLFAQKEYHYYSDQPETNKPRIVKNSFSFTSIQVKENLYINLKLSLVKRKLNSSTLVNFLIDYSKNNKLVANARYTDSYISFDGNYYIFKIKIEAPKVDSCLISVKNTNESEIGNTDFQFTHILNNPNTDSLTLLNVNMEPITTIYSTLEQPIIPVGAKNVCVRWHEYDNHKSLSIINSSLLNRGLNVKNKIKKISGDQTFLPSVVGYYEFSVDTNFKYSHTLRVVDETFPQIKSATLLLEPLAYLTDSISYLNLFLDNSGKKSLDKFWLSLFTQKQDAKKAIKLYYNRVFKANELYTQYNLGWKSDRGLVSILLGEPESKKVENNSEIWIYNNSESVKFIKNKVGDFDLEDFNTLKPKLLIAIEQIKKGIFE